MKICISSRNSSQFSSSILSEADLKERLVPEQDIAEAKPDFRPIDTSEEDTYIYKIFCNLLCV